MSENVLLLSTHPDIFNCIWNSRLEIIFHQNFEGLALSYLLVYSIVTEVSEPFWFLMIRMLSVLPTAKTFRIFLSLVLWHLWWCALGWFFFISTGPCQSEDSCSSVWKVFTSFLYHFPPLLFLDSLDNLLFRHWVSWIDPRIFLPYLHLFVFLGQKDILWEISFSLSLILYIDFLKLMALMFYFPSVLSSYSFLYSILFYGHNIFFYLSKDTNSFCFVFSSALRIVLLLFF